MGNRKNASQGENGILSPQPVMESKKRANRLSEFIAIVRLSIVGTRKNAGSHAS
jgi:hypothetical protein